MNTLLQFGKSRLKHLRSFGRSFLYSPIRRLFQPLLAKIAAVKEPTRHLIHHAIPVTRSKNQPCKPITIISANLWHDWPWHRQLFARLSAFAGLVESEEADIVLLQEVARTAKIKADEWLAERLGMGYVYARANGHEFGIGFEEGLAVFSRFPLETPRGYQLSESAFQMSRRMALGTNVKTPCGNLMVFSVHLGVTNKDNQNQVVRLRDWVGSTTQERTALIGGDFNAHENRSQIRDIQSQWLDIYRQKNPESDGTTHELRWPWGKPLLRHRLDYLFMQRGIGHWNVLDTQHLGAPVGKGIHSDHRAVMARLAPAYHE